MDFFKREVWYVSGIPKINLKYIVNKIQVQIFSYWNVLHNLNIGDIKSIFPGCNSACIPFMHNSPGLHVHVLTSDINIVNKFSLWNLFMFLNQQIEIPSYYINNFETQLEKTNELSPGLCKTMSLTQDRRRGFFFCQIG